MADPSETVPEPTAAAAQHRPVNQILAWTGIAAAAVFIVAVVFFSGFVIGRSTDREYHHDRWNEMPGPGMMGPEHDGPRYGPAAPPDDSSRPVALRSGDSAVQLRALADGYASVAESPR